MPLHDIHAVMQSYLDDGWLREPQAVGLASFTAPELLARGFDELCDGGQLCLYEDERWFRRASRAVQASFKVYLQGGRLHANGLELGYQVRLASVLRAARRPLPPYRLLLEAGAQRRAAVRQRPGAAVCRQPARRAPPLFFDPRRGAAARPGAGELDLRAASEGHVRALYGYRAPEQLQRQARRGHAALRELARVLA
jgi:hypothetical protein